MQWGQLTTAQQTSLAAYQSASIRHPSYLVWVSGLGDPTQYITSIDVQRAIESARGRGHINVGTALLMGNNSDDTFHEDGVSRIPVGSKIKIWAGFSDLNVPIFTGVVKSVDPLSGGNEVEILCTDHTGGMAKTRVWGSQLPYDTRKEIVDYWAGLVGGRSSVASSVDELDATITRPTFEQQMMLSALEELCDSCFHVAFFDETGAMVMYERENRNVTTWTFDDDNVSELKFFAPTEIINHVVVEYKADNFCARDRDQASIDEHNERDRWLRIPWINHLAISDQTTGSSDEDIDNDLEGVKFTSPATAARIDTVMFKLKQTSGSANCYAKIYSDSGGSPSTLLATSRVRPAGTFGAGYGWEYFHFETPVAIDPSTAYWAVIDCAGLTGTLYCQRTSTGSAVHAYNDGSWHTEDSKTMLHRVYGSIEAERVAEDMVRYFKEPRDRVQVVAPAVPYLQLMDEVMLDVTVPFTVRGRFKVVGRRHVLAGGKYTTYDTLERT